MCDCIEQMNEKLEPYGQELNQLIMPGSKYAPPLISTMWIGGKKLRGKTINLIGSFCPFCGEEYTEEATND